jgi:hypothetical protein
MARPNLLIRTGLTLLAAALIVAIVSDLYARSATSSFERSARRAPKHSSERRLCIPEPLLSQERGSQSPQLFVSFDGYNFVPWIEGEEYVAQAQMYDVNLLDPGGQHPFQINARESLEELKMARAGQVFEGFAFIELEPEDEALLDQGIGDDRIAYVFTDFVQRSTGSGLTDCLQTCYGTAPPCWPKACLVGRCVPLWLISPIGVVCRECVCFGFW